MLTNWIANGVIPWLLSGVSESLLTGNINHARAWSWLTKSFAIVISFMNKLILKPVHHGLCQKGCFVPTLMCLGLVCHRSSQCWLCNDSSPWTGLLWEQNACLGMTASPAGIQLGQYFWILWNCWDRNCSLCPCSLQLRFPHKNLCPILNMAKLQLPPHQNQPKWLEKHSNLRNT